MMSHLLWDVPRFICLAIDKHQESSTPEEPEAIGIQCLTHADDGYVVLRYVKGYKAPWM